MGIANTGDIFNKGGGGSSGSQTPWTSDINGGGFSLTNAVLPSYLKLDQSTPQTIINDQPIQDTLTASKPVFTDSSKKLTSNGIGTSSQFLKADGSVDSNTYLTSASDPDPFYTAMMVQIFS